MYGVLIRGMEIDFDFAESVASRSMKQPGGSERYETLGRGDSRMMEGSCFGLLGTQTEWLGVLLCNP